MVSGKPPESELGQQRMRDISNMAKWLLVLFIVCILGSTPISINAATDPGDGQYLLYSVLLLGSLYSLKITTLFVSFCSFDI